MEELQRWNIGSKRRILKKHEFYFLELHGEIPNELNELFDQTRSLRRTLRCCFASGRSSPAGGFLTPFCPEQKHTLSEMCFYDFFFFFFFEGRSKNHHRVSVMLIYREAQPLLRSSACARLWVSWASPLIKVRPKCSYMYTCDLGFGFTA